MGASLRPPSASSLAALGRTLDGTLVVRESAEYDDARKVHNRRFDAVRPLAIAVCRSARDVARCVRWAVAEGVSFVPRCGGHNYVGASTCDGLVISVRGLGGVEVAPDGRTARVGAGNLSFDVQASLARHGLAPPDGHLPFGGHRRPHAGRRQGVQHAEARPHERQPPEVELVLASGELAICNERQNADLFWACRGGGGGAFGIATSFPVPCALGRARLVLRARLALGGRGAAFDLLRDWACHAPDALFVRLELRSFEGHRSAKFLGQYFGSEEATANAGPVLGSNAGRRAQLTLGQSSFFDAGLRWAYCRTAPSFAGRRASRRRAERIFRQVGLLQGGPCPRRDQIFLASSKR